MATDPTLRGAMPEASLFLTDAYPRADRAQHRDLCSTGRAWLGNHGYFRDLIVSLDGTLARVDPFSLNTRAFSDELSLKVQRLLGGLSGHHRVEDEHYFPAFRAAEPRLGVGIDVLDADHHFIHGAIVSMSETAVRIINEFAGPIPTPGATRGHLRDDFRNEVRHFGAAMTRHLDDEEDLVIPFLLHRNGAAPLAA